MTYIIAECGVNWQNLSEAADLIRFTRRAGANAVKFQAYSRIDIVGHERRNDLAKIKLDPAKVSFLKGVADRYDLDFILTPFYEDAVAWSEAYVDKFKIRFADRYNVNLIEYVVNTEKPLIISCDHKYLDEMPDLVRDYENKTLMFCVPEYPPMKEPIYITCEGKFTGFSSHYPDPKVPIRAAEIFADVIEVHLQGWVDVRNPPIDSAVSLNWRQLRQIVEATKRWNL